MKNAITISVIIPVYNAEASLKACIDNVCGQTLENYEVICIDDCSSDHSYQILCDCAEAYPNLVILRQNENLGAGPARNRGIEKAGGEYVAFMDADDAYPDTDTLKQLYNAAKRNDALICGGGVLFKRGNEIKPGEDSGGTYTFEREGWIEYKDCQQFFYYQRFIYHREMLQKNQISFPAYLRFQDPPFFVKAMITAKRFYALPESVYVYVNDGAHVTWNDKKVNDMLKGVLDVVQMCLENRMGLMYFKVLERHLNNRYIMGILENSYIQGNEQVVDFYREILNGLDRELLGENAEKLDIAYAEKIVNAKLTRNMRYHYRTLDLQNGECKENKPKVSVVIPVYNTEKYLSLCLSSIVGQTLEDIEIICIDDGSTDGSSEILDKFARRYNNMSVYRQENSGLSAARNAGMQHARGEYVYFMDSDDYLNLVALEELYHIAKADKLDIVYFAAESFFESKEEALEEKNRYYATAYKRDGVYPGVMSGRDMLIYQRKNKDYYTPVWIQMFRTQFIRENGLGFFEGLLHEDNLFSLSAIVAAQRVRCINNVYFYRRIRKNSIMTSAIDYRTVLGYYLTAVEEMKLLQNLKLRKAERDAYAELVQGMLKNHVTYKWNNLSLADRALFLASLTAADRALFESFVLPMIELRTQIQKIPKNQIEAEKQLQNLKKENKKLKEDYKALKKTTVSKESRSYKLGRWMTFIPRKIRAYIRTMTGTAGKKN